MTSHILGRTHYVAHSTRDARSRWSRIHAALASVSHLELGKRFLVTALVFFLLGGIEAMLMRLQLAQPVQQWPTQQDRDAR